MRIIFMGTPDFAVPTLVELVARGHDVAAVYTRAPRPAGRGQDVRKSPVHLAAEGFGLEVRTPKTFKSAEDVAAFSALAADVGVVAAYGLLLPKAILDAPRHGCLNLHGSALPRWRGAAPIQRAVMAGDPATAAMVMKMDEGLDTGPVALSEIIPIGPNTTSGELHDEMMRRGADLMARAVEALSRDALDFVPQSEQGVIYAKKIDKAETRVDFARPSGAVHNHIRGLSPFPGAWFELDIAGRPVRIKALRSELADGDGPPGTVLGDDFVIACAEGAVRLTLVQREGKGAMSATEFLRGTGSLAGKTVT
ncbi:MAG: methionyl-tRNA formyltransferase [Alphaproteobacteria bacterium]|nr:methionyl-tRNA formyltransferase [Alphaproteobacteria bacterium]